MTKPLKTPSKRALQQAIKHWAVVDTETANDIHLFFEHYVKEKDWLEVADQGRKIYTWMFTNKLHRDSPMAGLLDGVAAASADGVWKAVALAFGLEHTYVQYVLGDWYEGNEHPAPITLAEFMQRYEKEKADWEAEWK
jgi:hypothetical protein